jgi:hypothetical protein
MLRQVVARRARMVCRSPARVSIPYFDLAENLFDILQPGTLRLAVRGSKRPH